MVVDGLPSCCSGLEFDYVGVVLVMADFVVVVVVLIVIILISMMMVITIRMISMIAIMMNTLAKAYRY